MLLVRIADGSSPVLNRAGYILAEILKRGKAMISLKEAKKAWQEKTPVFFKHPMLDHPIKCTIGAIEYSKRNNRLLRVTLIQAPGNSFIKTTPDRVCLSANQVPEKGYTPELWHAITKVEMTRNEGLLIREK